MLMSLKENNFEIESSNNINQAIDILSSLLVKAFQ